VSLILLAAGSSFAVFFVLNNVIQTLRRNGKIGFWDIQLTFLVTLVIAAAVMINYWDDAPDPQIDAWVLIAGAALAGISLLLMGIEVFRPQRLKGSRGLLGVFSGFLIALSSVGVPFVAAYFTLEDQPTPTQVVQAASTQETTTEISETEESAASPTPTLTDEQPTRTSTARPSNTPTPSRTRFQFTTRTPAPTLTPTEAVICQATVTNNLRLRSEPSQDAETLLTIPADSVIFLRGRNEDSLWWQTEFDDQAGWVLGQYLLLAAACQNLPISTE